MKFENWVNKNKKEIIEKFGLIVIMMDIALIIISELKPSTVFESWVISICILILFIIGLIMYIFPDWFTKKKPLGD